MITNNILELVKHFEGYRPTYYKDLTGKPTIGYGLTLGDIDDDLRINRQIAHYATLGVMAELHQSLKSHIVEKGYCLPSNRCLEAFSSLAYNVGLQRVLTSDALKETIRGNWRLGAANFLQWRLANGEIEPGLERRRLSELHYWLTGELDFHRLPQQLDRGIYLHFVNLGSEFLT